jgi:hypothetical protein
MVQSRDSIDTGAWQVLDATVTVTRGFADQTGESVRQVRQERRTKRYSVATEWCSHATVLGHAFISAFNIKVSPIYIPAYCDCH